MLVDNIRLVQKYNVYLKARLEEQREKTGVVVCYLIVMRRLKVTRSLVQMKYVVLAKSSSPVFYGASL